MSFCFVRTSSLTHYHCGSSCAFSLVTPCPSCPSSPPSLSCPCRGGASCGHGCGRCDCGCDYGCGCGCDRCCCFDSGSGCADLCGHAGCGHSRSRGHSDGPRRQRARQARAPARGRVRARLVASRWCPQRRGRSSCGRRAPWPRSSQPAALAARARHCGCDYGCAYGFGFGSGYDCGCDCCSYCGCCHCVT